MIAEQRPDYCYRPNVFNELRDLKLKKTPYCEKCRIRTKDLIVSFIDKPLLRPDERYCVENMICLCKSCYSEAMKLAGCYNYFNKTDEPF